MGFMKDGVWHEGWYDPDTHGRFQRPPTKFHGRVTADGSGPHPAAPRRYHLLVSYACPWAHRTLIARRLHGLEEAIDVSVVDPRMGDEGWVFAGVHDDPFDGATEDGALGRRRMQDVYRTADPKYSGRVTVPVLFDTKTGEIVNNESREILRMLGRELHGLAAHPVDLCPTDLEAEIDATLDALYEPVNDGVYKCGFAGTQDAYDEACRSLFDALDRFDARLSGSRYLCGNRITEADVAFYATLVRFDLVYFAHFKCNVRPIADYPNLSGYLRDLYQTPGFGETTRLDHIKVHYYWSQPTVNPTRIVPLGPPVDLDAPHDRARLGRLEPELA